MGGFAYLALLLIPISCAMGVLLVKLLDQKRRDGQRKGYKLAFPSDLDEERVVAWIRSVSGTLRFAPVRVSGVPTIGFETWASSEGIQHRLKVPWQHADYVIAQLRSLVPGIHVAPEDEFPRRRWTRAVEVGMTSPDRQLRIYNAADTSASLLAALQALSPGETVLLQWVITPAIPGQLPIYKQARTNQLSLKRAMLDGNVATKDEVHDRRGKLEEPNVMAVLRVAAVAETDVRADHLIHRIRASLSATRSPSSRFTKRMISKAALQERIDEVGAPVHFPMQLSAPEIAALLSWPIGNPFVAGLPPRMTKHLPASSAVPQQGRVIGRSNFPGNERPIALSYTDARKHMHVVGPTGSGKTVLLANMIKQDIEQGYGVVVIEPKGDLFRAALNYIPPSRINDVIILDISDTRRPVGFNILDQGNPAVVIDELEALFESMYDSGSGVWTKEVLYHGLHTLASLPAASFVDLGPLLVPSSPEEATWRDDVIRSLKDRELRNFWQRFGDIGRAEQDRITRPVMSRIWQLSSRPEVRHVIGQSKSTFQMRDVIRDNKILLVNLEGAPEKAASLLGTLLVDALWRAVKTTDAPRPNFLYLDEFQSFISLPISPEDMLAKARGFGLGMTLAHQHLEQLPSELESAVLANARTKIVFQTTESDANAMAREFGNPVDKDDFKNLAAYEVLARVATATGVSPPLTVSTLPPEKGHNKGHAILSQVREQYGRPVQEVQAEIEARRTMQARPATRKKPRIGSSEGWG